ncbi:MAG: S9 family peptidase [Saccharolobus sp.]
MNYEDLSRIKPVYDYDVFDNNLALVIREKKPIVVINSEKIDISGYAEEVQWISKNKLFITIDQAGGEKREIYLFEEGKLYEILKDSFDNFSPYPINSGFVFLSNRDGRTIHLYYYDGKSVNKISNGSLPVSDFCIKNNYIVYSQGIYDNDIIISTLNGDVIDKISIENSEQYTSSINCFINDDEFLFLSNHNNFLNVYKYNIKEGKISAVIEDSHEIYEAVPYKGGIVYVRDNLGDFEVIYNNRKIVEDGFNHDIKIDNDYIYFISSNYDHSSDVFRYKHRLERLTNSMDDVRGNFVKPKKVSYDSNGITIHALLYEKGNEEKGVVYIHGGPDWECVNSFNPEIQFLLAKGFKVICPNYRGSTGFGRRFNHLNDKDLGGGDLLDVINSIKVLGVKKLAITGASYGGYLTMMSITKYPELWCAAAAIVPFVNWFTEKKFEREVLRQYDEIKMGDDEKLLRERSPIFFVNNIRTPLLILAGENDPRCPAEETLQIVKELEKLGKEVRYKIYKDEGHGFEKIENYIDSIRETVEFINSHCV